MHRPAHVTTIIVYCPGKPLADHPHLLWYLKHIFMSELYDILGIFKGKS